MRPEMLRRVRNGAWDARFSILVGPCRHIPPTNIGPDLPKSHLTV